MVYQTWLDGELGGGMNIPIFKVLKNVPILRPLSLSCSPTGVVLNGLPASVSRVSNRFPEK
jgi:hypothetical protein